jgi:hypothetical protein
MNDEWSLLFPSISPLKPHQSTSCIYAKALPISMHQSKPHSLKKVIYTMLCYGLCSAITDSIDANIMIFEIKMWQLFIDKTLSVIPLSKLVVITCT